jgi:hypothetical protein
MAGGADSGEGRRSRKPRARRDIKDAHPRCDLRGLQQEGHEIRGDVREGAVVLRRRRILELQFLCHPE